MRVFGVIISSLQDNFLMNYTKKKQNDFDKNKRHWKIIYNPVFLTSFLYFSSLLL